MPKEKRKELEEKYGEKNVYSTKEVEEEFEIISFLAPYCTARRRSDNKQGVLEFCDNPRFYFDFKQEHL